MTGIEAAALGATAAAKAGAAAAPLAATAAAAAPAAAGAAGLGSAATLGAAPFLTKAGLAAAAPALTGAAVGAPAATGFGGGIAGLGGAAGLGKAAALGAPFAGGIGGAAGATPGAALGLKAAQSAGFNPSTPSFMSRVGSALAQNPGQALSAAGRLAGGGQQPQQRAPAIPSAQPNRARLGELAGMLDQTTRRALERETGLADLQSQRGGTVDVFQARGGRPMPRGITTAAANPYRIG